jgi:hydrogenase maturation protease
MRRVVVGCGNPDRGDDGAGILVARRLREFGVDAIENRGDLIALPDSWEGAEQAIIVDTVITGAAPGEISLWDARNAPVEKNCFRCSTHAFGVAEAVELARLLDRLPPSLWIYGIEGSQFEPGTGVSAAVARAVEKVAQEILCMKPL